ncbi:MAG TPA: XdhC family protein, partial [Polyangia bacterium]
REMFARVKERGATDAELARVEAPLGLAIGAESPAEIAVSIVGGIIAHHKGVARALAPQPLEVRDDEEAANRSQAQPA